MQSRFHRTLETCPEQAYGFKAPYSSSSSRTNYPPVFTVKIQQVILMQKYLLRNN